MQITHTRTQDTQIEDMLDASQVAKLWKMTRRSLIDRVRRGQFPVMPRQGGKGSPLLWAPCDIRQWHKTGLPVDMRRVAKRGGK